MSEYSTRAAYDLYVYYLAVKRHFTSNYDYFKYNGKVKVNGQSFEKRRDKFFFYKLSKRRDAKDLILANILKKPDVWVGDLMEERAEEVYKEWKKNMNSLSYSFKQDLKKLDPDFDSNFVVKDGQHPKLLKLYLQGEIRLETLTILNSLTRCFSYWDKKIQDNITFPHINKLVSKYEPFMSLTQERKTKLREIVVHEFK